MDSINQEDYGISSSNIETSYKKLALSNDVEITENILNEKGVLLLKAGSAIDKRAFDNIVNHKLLKPIDESLRLKNQLSPEKLLDEITEVCREILGGEPVNFEQPLELVSQIISTTDFDDTTLNKLTVFSNKSQDNFSHSLATAILCTKIGVELGFSFIKKKDIFNAGLFHDLGEMFLDFDVHSVNENLTEEQYKKIKVHPIIAYTLLKESKTNFSDDMLHGVLDHHERLDGSGYPRSISGAKINECARIVGIVDTFDAMLRKGRSVEDALWAMKLYVGNEGTTSHAVDSGWDEKILSILYSFKDSMSGYQKDKENEALVPSENLQQLLLSLDIIWTEVSLLRTHISKYIDQSKSSHGKISGQFAQVGNLLTTIEKCIYQPSGFAQVDALGLPDDDSFEKALINDIKRIAPELKQILNRVNRSITHLETVQTGNELSEISIINKTLRDRSDEVAALL